jgi:hypothetical protein
MTISIPCIRWAQLANRGAAVRPELVFGAAPFMSTSMDLATAKHKIEATLHQMRSSYGDDVFNEWAVISLEEKSWNLVSYSGTRQENFRADLPADLKPLAETSTGKVHAIGDFEFAADAKGTRHDAMMRLGASTYLICNNTTKTMAEIRSKHRWLTTQRSFAAMSETFHSDPLIVPAASS